MILTVLVLPALIAIVNAQHSEEYCGPADRNASIPGDGLTVTLPKVEGEKVECLWKIHTHPGRKVEVTILKIKLQNASICRENVLDIYYGNTTQHAPYDRLCCLSGGRTKVYTSTGFFIYLHLLMQNYEKDDGIYAIYNDVAGVTLYQHDEDICGPGDIVISKVSSSWVVPVNGVEAANKQCRWILIADKGKRVEVTIEEITFKNDAACRTNKLLFTDGVYENETQLGTICNMQASKTVFTSNGRYMFVKFVALDVGAGKGFKAQIRQINSARKMVFSQIWNAGLLMALWYNYY